MNNIKSVAFLLVALLAFSCAIQSGGPQGGPQDKTPPELRSAEPPNLSTHFNSKDIKLNFNEQVDLQSAPQEATITPQPTGKIIYQYSAKTVTIDLSKVQLNPNTTYTINFAKSVKDVHEGNIKDNFTYIFSTGSFIDSLKLRGSVIDALSGEPSGVVRILLFSGTADSALLGKKPLYSAATNPDGSFEVSFLPKGKFSVFALEDKNSNFVLDADEKAGFVDDLVSIDSAVNLLKLPIAISKPNPKHIEITRADLYPGNEFVRLNGPADSITSDIKEIVFQYNNLHDSISLWHSELGGTKVPFHLFSAGLKSDTILTIQTKKISKYNLKLDVKPENSSIFGTPVVLSAPGLIKKVDVSKMQLFIGHKILKLTGVEVTKGVYLPIKFAFNEDSAYKLKLLPGAVQSTTGELSDSTTFTINLPARRSYAYLQLPVKAPVLKTGQYIYQLINESGMVVYEKSFKTATEIYLPYLNPGTYKMRLVLDENLNGIWDPVSIYQMKQAEKVYYYPGVLNLKANWEIHDQKFFLEKL